MTSAVRSKDMIIGITPFGEPDARLASAVSRAGGLGVLGLGDGDRRSREALARLHRPAPGAFGIRVGPRCRLVPADLVRETDGDEGFGTVVLAADAPWQIGDVAARHRVLVEVTDLHQAREAVRAGGHGLIARGRECGGRIGELSTFVLLQQLLAASGVELPVWACGGIGRRGRGGRRGRRRPRQPVRAARRVGTARGGRRGPAVPGRFGDRRPGRPPGPAPPRPGRPPG
ncbi:hypothetical protein ABZ904_25895 [Streptomyces sp. NPDC046900]|uniref:hypothetical protein n=1 Tax=Streptomyces sp. NPDC046900 TaxID=3155473 RepID=UPI0033C86098